MAVPADLSAARVVGEPRLAGRAWQVAGRLVSARAGAPLRVGRPLLVPALRPVWRGTRTLQLGLDPARAVVLDDVDERLARLLLELDGSRTGADVLTDCARAGLDPAPLGALLDELHSAGALAELPAEAQAGGAAEASGWPPGDPGRPPPGRLAPDYASLALLAGAEGAAERLDRRRAATVVVHGAGRLGATAASLLGAAGVGHVHVIDRGPVRPADLAPAGSAITDVDRPRMAAAADAVWRSAPEVDTSPPAAGQLPHLVLLAGNAPVDTELRAALHATGRAHLVAAVRETTAVVGPLVLPAATSCLRCADLHRVDRDPAWPLIAAQLSGLRRRPDEPCDVVLATLAAALAALECLAYLDGRLPPSVGATLELALPDWRLRRRTWPPHGRCGCGAGPADGDEPRLAGAAATAGEAAQPMRRVPNPGRMWW